jgi:hypothetical protein
MPVSVVDFFEMIDVHHQHAERSVFRARAPLRAAAPRKTNGSKAVRSNRRAKAAVNLPLIFAVDFVEHLKTQNVFADRDFIAVLQSFALDFLAVEKRSAARAQIGQNVLVSFLFRIKDRIDARVRRETFASLMRTSASSARPKMTSSRSSGIGTASKSPLRKTSAGRKSRCGRFDSFIVGQKAGGLKRERLQN